MKQIKVIKAFVKEELDHNSARPLFRDADIDTGTSQLIDGITNFTIYTHATDFNSDRSDKIIDQLYALDFVTKIIIEKDTTWSRPEDFVEKLEIESLEEHRDRSAKVVANRLRMVADAIERDSGIGSRYLMDIEVPRHEPGQGSNIMEEYKILFSKPWGG